MKPSFALNFTDDSVALLHRTKRGWLEIGQTPYDTPDLPQAMAYLRATALGLSPQGITTKLVLPPSQVRYFRIEAPGPADATRRAQIAAALDGQTAYAVEELAFDWSGTGPVVSVAVVSRETLAEAEDFALAHRFGPVSFVTLPADGTFTAEPWFGQTGYASSVLGGGDIVERDGEPMTILSRSLARSADAAPSEPAPPVSDPPAEPAPQPAPEPEPDPIVEPDPAPTPEPPPAPEPAPAPEPQPDPQPAPEPEPVPAPLPASVPEPAPELPEPEPLQIPQPDVTPDPGDDDPMPLDVPGYDPVGDPVTMAAPQLAPREPAPAPQPDADEAPIALDVEDDDPPAQMAQGTSPSLPKRATNVTENTLTVDDEPPVSSVAFSSRRLPALAQATSTAAQNMARRLGAASRGSAPAQPPAARSPKLGFADPADPPHRAPTAAAASLAAKPAPEPRPEPRPGPRPANAPAPAAPARATARPVSATKASRPGPRSLTAPPPRGKPRYLGLILTGLLLVALALAAALSSYYSARNDSADPTALASATGNAEPEAAVPDVAPAPSVDDEMLADGQDPEAAADPAGGDITAADLGVPTEPAVAAAAPAPAMPTETPALPGASDGNDEIYLSASDVAPSAIDAAALPLPEAQGDPAPLAPLPPPAFGTVYTFDANGLIVPTPEGITTPEGVLLVAGKPPRVPPARPADLAPPAPEPALPATRDQSETQTSAFPADPALRGKRPAARPATLVAVAPAETPAETAADAPSLAPLADSRLASVRPLARPVSLAAESGALALVAPDGAITPLGGLALSPRPVARPSVIASAVEAAVAAASQQSDPDPPAEIVDDGTVTPETEAEPQLASAAPSIPTKANVAKEATDKNVINLGKINLIGVYGTQSNRYALVRQPNGRIIKVGVGDRIDGGRVAAVTATEVRYEKRGQMLVLAMPRG